MMDIRSILPSVTLLMVVSTIGGAQSAASGEALEVIAAGEIAAALEGAALREGPAPVTPDGIPHQQHNQNAPVAMQEALKSAAAALPGIEFEPTPFSLSGSVGWRLAEGFAGGPVGAFIPRSLEFAHQHRPSDGSLHMLLPVRFAATALDKGWGVVHPFSDSISGERSEYVMIFGPRNESELETVWTIAQISYYQARGISMEPRLSRRER